MPLTDTSCKNAKPRDKQYKLADGNGMHLLIKPNGGKYWRLKYRFLEKEKLLAFGVYPEISLKEARDKRDAARKLLSEGTDPSEAKKAAKREEMLKTENDFESIAREWHENQKQGWTERHANYVLRRLEADIFPAIGNRPIKEIKPPELLQVLRVIEARGAVDIAKRALQTSGQIFRYAVATGKAERDISYDLKGALKTVKKKHYAHLEASELPEFMSKLEDYDGDIQTKLAIKLVILTFVRTGELRGVKWDEIDFENAEWHIPAERMKMREKHIVPLSKQVLSILEEMKQFTEHGQYIFPHRSNLSKCMSENTMLYAIYRMGYHSRTTIHGFRGTASTILNEQGFNVDVIERQLAHSERNKVRASYNHAQYLPERKKMMQHWSDYIEAMSKKGSNVVSGRFGEVV